MHQQEMRTFRRHARFERLVSLFERDEIEDAVDALIAALDARAAALDPDAPIFTPCLRDGLPGDGEDAEPEVESGGWPEWHSLRAVDRRAGTLFPQYVEGGYPPHEDDEAGGDEDDGNFAEDEESARARVMMDGPGCVIADPDKGIKTEPQDEEHYFGPGAQGQVDGEDDGAELRRPHRDRIRETRCRVERIPAYGGGFMPHRYVLCTGGYRLLRGAM